MLSNATNQPKSIVELGYMCLRGLLGPPAVTIIKYLKYEKRLLNESELNSTSTYAPAQLTKDQLLVHHINSLTKIDVKIDKCELPTIYWLPKLHKRPYKSRLYQIQVTALLPFFRSILHLL